MISLHITDHSSGSPINYLVPDHLDLLAFGQLPHYYADLHPDPVGMLQGQV